MTQPTFSIVTPVRNGVRFIDETILSTVTQAGPFYIKYHIQDGGSTDGTLERLERWSKRLSGDFPIFCSGVKFTYSSEPDNGLYDAINKGFRHCDPSDFIRYKYGESSDYMSWINSDDWFEHGAFASIAEIFQKYDGDFTEYPTAAHWICSRPLQTTETGCQAGLAEDRSFPRKAIRAGIFDGRFSPYFLQQEGTFWRRRLWEKVGGLRSNFRLAGDFDLWRRFSQHTDLVMADAFLGCFRIRTDQLSSNIENYWKEIDQSLTPEEKANRSEVAETFRNATTPKANREAGFLWRLVSNHPGRGGWLFREMWHDQI